MCLAQSAADGKGERPLARLVFPARIPYNRAMPKPKTHTDFRPDVLILGAGPSGLLCALTARQRGRRVTLVDASEITARKLRASGGGRSNCTNRNASPEHYLSADPKFTAQALKRYTPQNFLALLDSLGLSASEEDFGRLFCDQGATPLTDALEGACRTAGCRFLLNRRVEDLTPAEHGFHVDTDKGPLDAPRVVLALGSPAWPTLGGTDATARLAGALGLAHVPARPALTPLAFTGAMLALCRDLSGLGLTASVSALDKTYTDGLLFTHQGLSGPAALQISSHWRKGATLTIDLAPQADLRQVLREPGRGKTMARTAIASLLPRRLAEALLAKLPPELAAAADRKCAELSKAQMEALALVVHAWQMTPSGTLGMSRAEAASGGLDTRLFSPKTFECRKLPGLFAIGEALDVAGELGGYNLHWAWASGFCAGQAV
ncbi:MAG: aminoacetone oxidase family FAD-binding enzyme [Deltaproteobacteria bacterium HGW-Deltaproteobacteria-8]|nr:MAG: aminoacetone oxidase family FAD-binding enzyme [Deltaproteobacteria bacterium HGW-Deltaproteobacteria-8]